jgi:2-polyprenyl-3-methyl-5-hydroxy-6-metoxy-1,4-benzoquinol methylase
MNAARYDKDETCVNDKVLQRILINDLHKIIHLFNKPTHELKALDACAGSGNVAFKLLRLGIDVTVVDASEDLLNILRKKCSDLPYLPTIYCDEIASFFDEKNDEYDLIVFSSALHHIQDVKSVLRLAYSKLKRGGFIFTIYDPSWQKDVSWLGKKILRLDYLLHKVRKQPKKILSVVSRKNLKAQNSCFKKRTKSIVNHNISDEALGTLTEYHVNLGINDIELVKYLRDLGYEVLWHKRYVSARHTASQWLLTMLGDKNHFKLLITK